MSAPEHDPAVEDNSADQSVHGFLCVVGGFLLLGFSLTTVFAPAPEGAVPYSTSRWSPGYEPVAVVTPRGKVCLQHRKGLVRLHCTGQAARIAARMLSARGQIND